MIRKLVREPLVQFLLLGTALFALDAWLRPSAAPTANAEIVVSEARIRNLAQNFRRTWQRPPTRVELEGLVEAHVREEVFYREALALGLERDDAIIRRRLQQKMEFVSEEAAALAKPTDEDLSAYLKTHAEAFRKIIGQIDGYPDGRTAFPIPPGKDWIAEVDRGAQLAGRCKFPDNDRRNIHF